MKINQTTACFVLFVALAGVGIADLLIMEEANRQKIKNTGW
jgi:hypothetical protein